MSGPPATAGRDSTEILLDWGFTRTEVDALLDAGVVGQAAASVAVEE